jgi:DNA-binding transcriptional MerR regulator
VQSGELSRLAGVSPDTLRHYERLGIIPKPPRTNGGYRDYPAESLDRVRLIQSALKVGFSLSELATILQMRDRGEAPCRRVRDIALNKLQDLQRQIIELQSTRDQLERIIKDWDARLAGASNGRQARLLENLPHDTTGSNTNRLKANLRKRGRR